MSTSRPSDAPESMLRRRRVGWILFAVGVPGLILLLEAAARLAFGALDFVVLDDPTLDRLAVRLGLAALAGLPALIGLRMVRRATPLEGGPFGRDLATPAPWIALVVGAGLALPFLVPLYRPLEPEPTAAHAAETWLRTLAEAQERHRDEHFSYQGNLMLLELPPPPEPMAVHYTATGRSWSARLVDPAGHGCAARYGEAPPLATPGGLSPGDNEIVCDPF